MLRAIQRLDELSEMFATTSQRLLVTILAAGLLVAVIALAPKLQQRLREHLGLLARDVIMGIVLLGSFVLVAGVTLGTWGMTGEILAVYEQEQIGEEIVPNLVLTVVVFAGTHLAVRLAHRGLRDVLTPSAAVSEHQQEVAYRVTQVMFYLAALLIVFAIWDVDLSGLLIGAGFLGIVLGMAARQTIGAMIAGFVLMFAKPFQVGDWIQIEDDEGIVTDISIVNTRIRAFDGEYLMIPNDVVTSRMLRNKSELGRLRVDVEVGVDYDTDLERASALAEDAVSNLPMCLNVPAPNVVSSGFDDSAILLEVRFWIDKPSRRRFVKARSAAVDAITDAFREEGIKIPFPQREVSQRLGAREERTEADASTGADPGGAPAGRRRDPPASQPDAQNAPDAGERVGFESDGGQDGRSE